jgi:hypothetical protein
MGTTRQGRNLDETSGGPPPLAEWRSQPVERGHEVGDGSPPAPPAPSPSSDLRGETPHRAALELLRAATQYEAPPGRQRRVRLALDRTTASPRRWLLQPAVIVAVLIGGAAASRGALGRWPAWVTRAYERLVPNPSVPAAGGANDRGGHQRVRTAAAKLAKLDQQRPATAAAAIDGVTPPAVGPARRLDPPATTRARHPATSAGADDTSLVLSAMRALRREHDPATARTLLAAYLDRYPNGTLAQEALAMSIEAAVAHGDRDADLLAQRYLRLYPDGPFTPAARQAAGQD